MPFSIGPRGCIGNNNLFAAMFTLLMFVLGKLFAMLLLKYFTVSIIQKYEILPVEGHVLKKGGIVLKSSTGTPIILKKRCN